MPGSVSIGSPFESETDATGDQTRPRAVTGAAPSLAATDTLNGPAPAA